MKNYQNLTVLNKVIKYLNSRKTAATATEIVNATKVNYNTLRRLLAGFKQGNKRNGLKTYTNYITIRSLASMGNKTNANQTNSRVY